MKRAILLGLLPVIAIALGGYYTHSLSAQKQAALEELSRCPIVAALIGSPISIESAESTLGRGTWDMAIAGPRGKVQFECDVEKHAGKWQVAAGLITIGKLEIDLTKCYEQSPVDDSTVDANDTENEK